MSGLSSTKASVKELTPLPIDFDIADGKSESETTSIFLFIFPDFPIGPYLIGPH